MGAPRNAAQNHDAKRRNAVTQGAICTWVARLRPSDRGAIAAITCAGTPTLIPRCGAHGVAFSWRVDRNATRVVRTAAV